MLHQSSLIDELTHQRIAELHAAAGRERLAARPTGLRVWAGRWLIAVGTRLAPTEARATNRVTKLAGR
jgi:hypothetical protein